MEQTHAIVNNSAPRCPYCHEAVTIDSSKTACESCMAWHHKDCWAEHGACSACGREQSDPPETHSSPNHPAQERIQICQRRDCSEAAQSHLKVRRYQKLCLSHATEKADKSASESTLFTIAASFFLLFLIVGIGSSFDRLDEFAPITLSAIVVVVLFGLANVSNNRVNLKKLKKAKDMEK